MRTRTAAGADLERQTFMRLQLISRCSIRKGAQRTKGENRQEAKHGQILFLKSRFRGVDARRAGRAKRLIVVPRIGHHSGNRRVSQRRLAERAGSSVTARTPRHKAAASANKDSRRAAPRNNVP
jgi:hypothetical protein